MPLAAELETTKKLGLPRRDWILLPLLSLLTVVILAGATEFTARRMFSYGGNLYSCFVQDDPRTGFRAIPNSVCQSKAPEVPQFIEYRFNSCGQRSDTECGPKPAHSLRVVLVGSSFVMGDNAKEDQAIAAWLPLHLERRTGQKIDIYNEGMMQESPIVVNLRMKRILNAKPDVILWVVTPWDIRHSSVVLPFVVKDVKKGKFMSGTAQRLLAALNSKSVSEGFNQLRSTAQAVFETAAAKLMFQHYLYQSESAYVQASLMADDDVAGFLKANYSSTWKGYLRQFDAQDAAVEAQARAARVPLVTVLIPPREMAAMTAMGTLPQGFDPYRLDNEVKGIVQNHGGVFLDILPQFRQIPNPEKYYLPVDGHPTPAGQEVIARLLAFQLTSGAVPQLTTKSSGP